MLADLRYRLRAVFNRSAMERDLDDELRFHVERETQKLAARGLSPDEAARQAAVAFGGMNRIKDDARDARGVAVWEFLRQDIGYAWRGLRARPGFTAAVVVALAIGIGANATMFSIVDRQLFRPPPFLKDADRVHRVYLTTTRPTGAVSYRTMEYSRYLDLTSGTTSFDLTGVIGYRTMAVGSAEETRDMIVAAMSATMFGFFDARPIIGRFFGAADDLAPTGSDVAVLSWGFWQSRYAGNAGVLGEQIRVGTRVYTIVGVAPRDFVGITESRSPSLFIPVSSAASQRNLTYPRTYGWSWLEMFARRRPDVSSARADADLSTAFQRSWSKMMAQRPGSPPNAATNPHAAVGSLYLSRGPEATAESKVFTWVMGVAAIVLLIACANVANLMLGRAITRRREIALRMALGVSRGRLMQQLATESGLLAGLGGAVGIAFAFGGGLLLRPFVGGEEERHALVDARTLSFTLGVTLVVAIATGLAPLLHSLRADVNDALKAGTRGVAAGRSPMRTGLLLAQGALSLVLLVGAGLFVRSLGNLRSMRMGYDTTPLVYAEAAMRGVRLDSAETAAMAHRMEDAAAATPGVVGATLAASIPFWNNEGLGAPIVAGRDSLGKRGRFLLQAGTPSYFSVTGTRILAGRGFLATDRAGTQPVAVISQRMADVIWPGENAIGKVFRFMSDTSQAITVVGVAENMRARLIAETDEIWYYLPFDQYRSADPQVFVRVRGDPAQSVETLRRRFLEVMPAGTYVNITPLETLVRRQGRSWELGAKMFVGFGAIALLLAAIGLYSVIAYNVAQRTREVGVRVALGATGGDVVGLIVGQGGRFAGVGIVIGAAIALGAGRWIEPLLFEQSARDPMVFGAAAALLLIVSLLAALEPALRAVRINPAQVLQSD